MKRRHKDIDMVGFYAYFSHSAQVTRNAHETLSPAKRRVFYYSDFSRMIFVGAGCSMKNTVCMYSILLR